MSDTTDRDQLEQIIAKHNDCDVWGSKMDCGMDYPSPDYTQFGTTEHLADAIVNAGWRPPARVVTTVEELDALAVGSVVVEGDHGTPDDTGMGFKTMPGVFHRFPDGWYVVAGYGPRDVPLPALVLWESEEQ